MNKKASKLLTAMLAVAIVSCGVVIMQNGNVKAADTITSNRLAVVAELEGNVSIIGEAKYDSTLTAEVTECNSTSLIYCWTRDNQLIEGATASEYTLTAEDIGCTIVCEVSATDREGMLIASLGSPVEKKDGPGQPEFEIVYPSAQNGDGKFVGVDPTMEYSTYQGLSMNVKQCPDGELTGLFAGDYYIRYAETATTKAGQIRHVWLISSDITGKVTLTGDVKYDSTLTAEVSDCNTTNYTYQWTRDGEPIDGAYEASYKLTEKDIGCIIGCEVSSSVRTGKIVGKTVSEVDKKDGPARPDLDIVYPSYKNGDGKIIGVDPSMEYSTYQGMSRDVKPCPDKEMTGLFAGDYYIRYAETDTTKAGEIYHVWLRIGPTPTPSTAPTVTEVPEVTKPADITDAPEVTKPADVTETPDITAEPDEKSFEDFVERLYVVALGRESEPEGKAFWCDEVKSGRREGAECAAGFLLSDEFLNKKLSSEAFVEVLYKTFFDRDSEAEGKAYWVSNLDNGTLSREDVINGFMDSTEWCNICASYGVKYGALTAKATVASENAIKFASRLYTECLGREAEEEGLNFWALSLTNRENKGISAGMQFFNSDEFLNKKTTDEEYIKLLYRTFMGRDFDDDGLAYWKKQLSEGVDRNEVLAGFAGSPEFAEICVSCGIDPI